MAVVRLDKFLAQSGERSRSEAGLLLRQGKVRVSGEIVRDPSRKIDPQVDDVLLMGEAVSDAAFQYVLFNKPAGVITAARDARSNTVMALVPEALTKRDVLPVGRLDKDTTGVLLLTNDGELAHRLLSPKRHVTKEYHVTVEGRLTQADVDAFAAGIQLSDFMTKPATMRILEASDAQSKAVLIITEGKFHQVKRMFGARQHPVITLHRAAFGPLSLPEGLAPGACRPVTPQELVLLKQAAYGEPELSQ